MRRNETDPACAIVRVRVGERLGLPRHLADTVADRPGDDDLEHVLGADALAHALDSTFRIVEACLDRWTLDMLDEELRRPEWDDSWVHTRGSVIQRVFSHDVYHCAELNEVLGIAGLPQVDLWD